MLRPQAVALQTRTPARKQLNEVLFSAVRQQLQLQIQTAGAAETVSCAPRRELQVCSKLFPVGIDEYKTRKFSPEHQ